MGKYLKLELENFSEESLYDPASETISAGNEKIETISMGSDKKQTYQISKLYSFAIVCDGMSTEAYKIKDYEWGEHECLSSSAKMTICDQVVETGPDSMSFTF